jgi:hypothetical protein
MLRDASTTSSIAAAERPLGRASFAVLALVAIVYGSALFSVDNYILDVAREGWQKIQLIEGTFTPTGDPQKLYQAASRSRAMDSNGQHLPELTTDTKMRPYDLRIIQQAEQERQLPSPSTFTK